MHVALVGFSVSADPQGYAKHLLNLADQSSSYSLEVIGVGGLHPRDMCFLIDRVAFGKKPDLILFEVLTSSARSNARPTEYIRTCLAQLVSAAAGMGADSAILNLYRDDVNYGSDAFLSSTVEFARKHDIALIDLAVDAIDVIARVGKENALADVVHPRRDLAKVYADRVHQAILKLTATTAKRSFANHPRGKVVEISSNAYSAYAFERSGLRIACTEIPEHQTARAVLPPEFNLVGIACLMGPQSGKLELRLDHTQVVSVVPYDDRCYYERLGFFYLGSHPCTTVEITQLSGVPPIPLVKGEVDPAPRLGRVYGLLVERLSSL